MSEVIEKAAPLQLAPMPPRGSDASPSPTSKLSTDDVSESSAATEALQHFEFTGTGSEYFRIWVVNVLLTILTVGVYSAWAKVRRLQYFYRNTRLAGQIFDYHGSPKAILKGRILAVCLVGGYKLADEISTGAAVVVALVMLALMPWLLARAFRFKLINSSYRGLRFRFHGTVADAYRTLILFPVVLGLTGLFAWSVFASYSQRPKIGLVITAILLMLAVLGSVVPWAHYLLKRYQHDNAYFGQAPFFFHAKKGSFFKIYAQAIGMIIIGSMFSNVVLRLTNGIYNSLANTMFGWLVQILYGTFMAYVLYLFARPFLESRIQNLVWNQTELADHRFISTARARGLLWIHASNLLLIVVTLGLYKPFAAIRIAQYRISHMALETRGNLEEFLADQSVEMAGAAGEEAGDFFDIDIAL